MKLLSALTLTALLGTSIAFAGTASSAGTATAPAAAASATHSMSSKACNKQADEKKLTGEARTTYVKDCREGKAAK
jgi:invasion protein IalB